MNNTPFDARTPTKDSFGKTKKNGQANSEKKNSHGRLSWHDDIMPVVTPINIRRKFEQSVDSFYDRKNTAFLQQ